MGLGSSAGAVLHTTQRLLNRGNGSAQAEYRCKVKLTSIVRRDSSFVAIVTSVTHSSAAFVKGHGVFFLAARMVNIVEIIVASNVLPCYCLQIY